MDTVLATCPICHVTDHYGAELVGRYTLCHSCRARFYVEAPTLGPSQTAPQVAGTKVGKSVSPEITLDDLLLDTQQGTRHIIQSLRRQEAGARAIRWLLVAVLLLGFVNLAATAFLLLR